MLHLLSHPEYFTLSGPDGQTFRGGDQEWFPDPWQRRAGCGPTTAATVLAYLSAVHSSLAPLAPGGPRTQEAFVPYLEQLWAFVTPGPMGLDNPRRYIGGCQDFAQAKDCRLEAELLEIPGKGNASRPSLDDCLSLLARALEADCPVAFLNFSNGEADNLDSWHWVPLIALEAQGGDARCTFLDEGREKVVDFALWHRTTRLGGALAAVSPAPLHPAP